MDSLIFKIRDFDGDNYYYGYSIDNDICKVKFNGKKPCKNRTYIFLGEIISNTEFIAKNIKEFEKIDGYKNISPVKKLDDEHIYSEKWDKILKINECDYDIKYICVRMNDISIGNGENQIEFKVKDIIENPIKLASIAVIAIK